MAKDSLEELAQPEYWNTRYSKDDADAKSYDWLRNFSSIQPFLTKHLPPAETSPQILHLGCGNSTLSADLYHLFYRSQTNIDFSAPVISQMRTQHPQMTWLVMDVRSLSFPSCTFDIAIDKATLDAMLYGSLWDPPDEVRSNVKKYVDEVVRVLNPGGKWLYITWRQPHFIRPLLVREEVWTVDVEVLGEGGGVFEYFGFVMRKGDNSRGNEV